MDNNQFADIQDFDVAKQQLARRRKLAEQLLATRNDTTARFAPNGGALFGGGLGQTLANGVDAIRGMFESRNLDTEEQQLAAQEAQQANSILSSIPASGPERQQALLNAGNRMPSLRNSISALLAADERARENELNRQARREEAEAKLIDAGEQKAADRVSRSDDLRYRMTTPNVNVRVSGGGSGGVKAPVGYRYNEDGTALEPIPGGPKDPNAPHVDKPLNEAQGNAVLFGTRAAQAHNILDEVGTNYSPIKVDMARGAEGIPLVGSLTSYGLGENEQKVFQAQRNFINAILRKESGAAIAQSEFDNARKQYFPQQGDGDAVIAQKRANRELAIKGLSQIAGPTGEKAVKAEQANKPTPTVVRTGKDAQGRKVEKMSDGTMRYAQ